MRTVHATLNSFFRAILAGVLFTLCAQLALAQLEARPPQFIMISFDGSKSVPMWQATREMAKSTNARITYFINGVYFLADQNKKLYDAPNLGKGKSAIGWGGNEADIQARIQEMNLAINSGLEIGSHANGHFDGSSWSQSAWQSEFTQFNQLIFNVLFNNSMGTGNPFGIESSDVKGFRAPQLGVSSGLWPTMRSFGMNYDASRVGSSKDWPKLENGIWNFPLASLRIAGSGKKTLSMDYNFYVAHSAAKEDLERSALYEKETFETYMNFFTSNYNGNRAPMNIGHHFSKWNGGAYWRAISRFAKEVCSKPEVQCATYSELVAYMNTLNSSQIHAYQNEQFAKLASLASFKGELGPALDIDIHWDLNDPSSLAKVEGKDSERLLRDKDVKLIWYIEDNLSRKEDFWHLIMERVLANKLETKVGLALKKGNREIIKSSRILSWNAVEKKFSISGEDFESAALIPDPEMAHDE